MTFSKIFAIVIFIQLGANFSYANELTEKYREIMNNDSPKEEKNLNSKRDLGRLASVVHEINKIEAEIKKVKDLKKDTFESSNEFEERKKHEIYTLENKINALTKGKYPAGTLTMKSYNADTEVLTAEIDWKKEFESLLSNIQGIKEVTINIPRNNAKKLFSKTKTHPVFITVKWYNNSLYMKRVILWGDNKKLYYAYSEKMKLYTIQSSPSTREKIIICENTNERHMIIKHSDKYCNKKPYDAYSIKRGQIRAECRFSSFKEAVKYSCQ